MILSFWTEWSRQIVQTQIRLLLEEQSDQGLHYLHYCLHLFDALLYGKTSFSSFRMITPKFSRVQKFRNFTVSKKGTTKVSIKTAQIRRLIYTFDVCICKDQFFNTAAHISALSQKNEK